MDVDTYTRLMEEVKNRITAITQILKKETTTSFQTTNVEFMCLQIRKILELISLGSLVANKREFDQQKIKYQKFWHAKRILNDIEKLNPDFYPQPVIEIPSSEPDIRNELVDKTEGFLTKKEFVKLYEKCGKILHADNPFGQRTDLNYYETQILNWLNRIIGLLNSHLIRLKGQENIYLIHMKEEGDDLVHAYDAGIVRDT